MAALEAAQVLAFDADDARRRFLLADQEPDEGGLAGAARPDEKDEVLLGNLQRHLAQGDGAVRVRFADAPQTDLRRVGGQGGHPLPVR